jgi:dihydroxy-acid dehydratase
LSVALTDAEIQKRMTGWKPPRPRYTHGVFAKYAALVSSSSLGAITTVPAGFVSENAPISSGRTL